jgi:hypothetical protein
MWKLIDKFVAPAGLFLGVAMLTLGALLMPSVPAWGDAGGGGGTVRCLKFYQCTAPLCSNRSPPHCYPTPPWSEGCNYYGEQFCSDCGCNQVAVTDTNNNTVVYCLCF